MNKAATKIRDWRNDPLQFVRECFEVEPDEWQKDVLASCGGRGVKREAMKACVGPGKSAVLAWLGWHRLSCYGEVGEHPKGAAVSITGDNLRDNLWPELSKWQQRSRFLQHAFEYTKTKIYAKDHPDTWFLSFRSFGKSASSEDLGKTLSGLHSKYPFILLDETGGMPVEIGRAAEQAMSGDVDGLIAQAGNPTSLSGLLYDSCVRNRTLWNTVTITSDPDDPKRTPRVSKEWAQQLIDKYGRDDVWVGMQILGRFPPSAVNSLLSADEVEAAIGRHIDSDKYDWAPMLVGCDVARFGDDRTVIIQRQGLASFNPKILRGARTEEIAAQVSVIANKKPEAKAIFVDGTGGYGGGVIDSLRLANYSPYEINSSSKPMNERFLNRRAEMWWNMAEWIKGGGALPNIPELVEELTAPTYWIKNGKLQLQSKEQIKEDIGKSPDIADALALTFAVPVQPDLPEPGSRAIGPRRRRVQVISDYDPGGYA